MVKVVLKFNSGGSGCSGGTLEVKKRSKFQTWGLRRGQAPLRILFDV
jgi:hypothetical protein